MSKAWMELPPTQSVPGTEDDERFYLPALAAKQRAKEYYERRRPMLRETARLWYHKNKEKKAKFDHDWRVRHRDRVREYAIRYKDAKRDGL